jgi:hypothetical protein
MSRNSDGTVVVKTPGRLAQTPSGGDGMGRVVTPAYKGTPTGNSFGLVFVGKATSTGWRIVSKTER